LLAGGGRKLYRRGLFDEGSQPAITEQLRLLESTLGVSLFNREKKRILLTPAGLAVHQFAIDVEAQFDALLERIGAARRTERRRTRRSPPTAAGRL
jgi:DNA-binding transcriptional LysR family regulator